MECISYTDKDFDIDYYPNFLSQKSAENLYDIILIESELRPSGWRRMYCTYGDRGVFYVTKTKDKLVLRKATEWMPILRKLRDRLSEITDSEFNHCLIQYFSDGNIGSKAKKDFDIVENSIVAEISLGATRKMVFTRRRHIEIELANGSLQLVKSPTCSYWSQHIEKDKKIFRPRISLTFRFVKN